MSNPVNVLTGDMEGPEVEQLQDEMISLGYMTLEQKNTRPGRFGPITEAAVKHFQSDNGLSDNGTFDLPAQAAVQQLNAGVRRGSQGGVVLPMQKRLVKAGKLTQAELDTGPGTFGQHTETALAGFQSDNQLEPNGVLTDETYRLLYKIELPASQVPTGDNVRVETLLPEQGVGFKTFLRHGPLGDKQFGTERTINALIELAKVWILLHPEVPLQFGPISLRGGPVFPPHETHRDGRCIDVRPIRKDNAMDGTDVHKNTYDQARTRELALLIRQRHPQVDIIFNDPDFIAAHLTRPFHGHDDHLHVHLPR